MDCPICFESITPSTGNVTTSCGHSYHFSCLSDWYVTQEKKSCPCCRRPPSPKEIVSSNSIKITEDDSMIFTPDILNSVLIARGAKGLSDAALAEACSSPSMTLQDLRMLCLGNGATGVLNMSMQQILSGFGYEQMY